MILQDWTSYEIYGVLDNSNLQPNMLPVGNGFTLLLAPTLLETWKRHFNVPDDKPFEKVELRYIMSYERTENGLLLVNTIKHEFRLNTGWADFLIGDIEAVSNIDMDSATAFEGLIKMYEYARKGCSL